VWHGGQYQHHRQHAGDDGEVRTDTGRYDRRTHHGVAQREGQNRQVALQLDAQVCIFQCLKSKFGHRNPN